jgi:hypothetical protein
VKISQERLNTIVESVRSEFDNHNCGEHVECDMKESLNMLAHNPIIVEEASHRFGFTALGVDFYSLLVAPQRGMLWFMFYIGKAVADAERGEMEKLGITDVRT